MITFLANDKNEVWWISVAPYLGIHMYLRMLLQRRTWRQLIIRGKNFPLDWRKCILEQILQKGFVNTLAIPAIGHDENSGVQLVETDGVVSPAIIVAFFEECFAMRRPVKSPCQTVTQLDRLIFLRGFIFKCREFVL